MVTFSSLKADASAMLEAVAEPEKARRMAAYMKADTPFFGVQKAERKQILRVLVERHPPIDPDGYRAAVEALWSLPHREEKYLAIGYASSFPAFVSFGSVPLYERLIVEGAWWDLVDDVAIRLAGVVWRDEREHFTGVAARWRSEDTLWLRRSAMIGQIKHRAETDTVFLFDTALLLAAEREFFIRKAIGWALREHAKTDPSAIGTFLDRYGDRLSGLSYREAAKHLGRR